METKHTPSLLAACKCAEADLTGLVLDYLDINIMDSNDPRAKTIRELRDAIAKAEPPTDRSCDEDGTCDGCGDCQE